MTGIVGAVYKQLTPLANFLTPMSSLESRTDMFNIGIAAKYGKAKYVATRTRCPAAPFFTRMMNPPADSAFPTELLIGLGKVSDTPSGDGDYRHDPVFTGGIFVVFEGTITNDVATKINLTAMGREISETHTNCELMAHYIAYFFETSTILSEAVSLAIAEIQGSYAMIVTNMIDLDKVLAYSNGVALKVVTTSEGNYITTSETLSIANQNVTVESSQLLDQQNIVLVFADHIEAPIYG